MWTIRTCIATVLCLAVSLLACSSAAAQLQVDKPSTGDGHGNLQIDNPGGKTLLDLKKALQPGDGKEDKSKTDQGRKPEPGSQQWIADDADLRAAYKKLLTANWDRDVEILGERRKAFVWQQLTSQIMFVVVHLFLALAAALAVREFLAAGQKRKEAPTSEAVAKMQQDRLNVLAALPDQGAPKVAAEEASPTELKLGVEGIALKTALHGVIILALAMGFYFMYLKFVYPISNV